MKHLGGYGMFMYTLLRIAFRHMEPSAPVEARVREHVVRLERFYGGITVHHVAVERSPAFRLKDALFDVQIDLTVAGREISVRSDCTARESHKDVNVALRDAFDGVRRSLRDHDLKFQVDVKRHELRQLATIPGPEADSVGRGNGRFV